MKEIAIITGGNSGLGEKIAKELLSRRINVCLIGRDEKKLDKVVKNFKENYKSDILKYNGNISDEKFVKSVYDDIDKEYNVKYLFNVAGVGLFGPPTDVDKEMIEEVIEANVIGLILMSTQALKRMEEENEGYLINIMSSAAKKGNPNESIYCAAKWGARGYTESLISWAKGTNIRIMGVFPGGINTPFWNKDIEKKPDTSKFMNPEEVAKEIVYSLLDKETIKISSIDIDRI